MKLRRRTLTGPDESVRRAWAACSAVLDYPTPALVASVDDLEALVADDPHLPGLLEHLRRTPIAHLQQDYVATFDHTRKCALYLTYFAYGDTRRRGAALVRFKEAYRAAGVELLRLALTGWRNDDGTTGSPWAPALVALCGTLPALEGAEADAVRRLVEQGPPAEEVGLAGYAADPALISSATIPVGAPR